MKDFYIADAARFDNQSITSYFCLASLSVRERKGGAGQYLALTLADKSGQFDARMWDDFADAVSQCSEGCYVKAQGQVSKYQGKFQITLTKLRPAAATEIDTADFIPTTQYDIAAMSAELRGYVAAFRNPHLRALVFAFLDDPAIGPAFAEAPAAKRLHHAWIGGLLEHVLTLVRVCLAVAPFYPEADPELVITGAILHDIGKVRELSWKSSFNYTLEGQLIGHISIAQGMLHEKIAALNAVARNAQTLAAGQSEDPVSGSSNSLHPAERSTSGFESAERSSGGLHPAERSSSRLQSAERSSGGLHPAEPGPQTEGALAPERDSSPASPPAAEPSPSARDFPDRLRLLIEHMVLSHHGKLEFGSPKLPMTPEAILLSALDDLEAKFQAMRNEFAAARSAGKSSEETTEWVRSMDRPLFNSRAYLAPEEKS